MTKKGSKNIEKIPAFIGAEDILRRTSQGWYIGKRKMSTEEVQALKVDAKYFHNSILWQMMRRDIHYIAYLKATNQAATLEDLHYANAMYRNLEVLEKFINESRAL